MSTAKSTLTRVTSPLTDDARTATGSALQGALVDLIDLHLLAKQAHWNLTGRNFRSIHLQLDEVVDVARDHADTVAERAVAVGVNPDGRARTVADSTRVRQLGPGYLPDDEVVAAVTDILAEMSKRFRERIKTTDETDLVTQDLLIKVAQDLEKQHWMFEAQR
ncbi:DNA starvation/stationary phase protection protein [Planosporangium thailandense]|uniref:DNA starvation/stationary phase protection protein n=1 Tax=Planosporangium thailandense TaxID=765197 RepID=A0ABX0Y450_9ACTN|nr:DNA starvation/stationary phase protection protein [Planosporangium thailandense]NJC73176.1 DNA starvation/stationary phase protection protein [Planosporangium thailandense]